MSAAVSETPPAARRVTRLEFDRYAPAIRELAQSVMKRAPRGIAESDLERAGFVALADAVVESVNVPLADREAHVFSRIRRAMLERIRSLDPRLCDLRGWSRKLVAALRDDGRWRDENEIAAAMERGLAEYRALLSWISDAGLDRLEVGDFDLDEPEVAPPALTVAAISGAVASLPDPDRLLLTLRHEEGCSDAEIALVLDIPEVRVRQRVCESMHRLRAMLGRT